MTPSFDSVEGSLHPYFVIPRCDSARTSPLSHSAAFPAFHRTEFFFVPSAPTSERFKVFQSPYFRLLPGSRDVLLFSLVRLPCTCFSIDNSILRSSGFDCRVPAVPRRKNYAPTSMRFNFCQRKSYL